MKIRLANIQHMEKESDALLMKKVACGERAALGELYLRHGRVVQKAIAGWLPKCSLADGEDLVQEIFVALGASAKHYQEEGRFTAWLYGIAYRKSMDMGRSLSRRNKKMEMSKQMALYTVGTTHPVSHDIRSEMRKAIQQMLNQLSAELREVLVLKIVEGFSASEIGQITGVAEATARTRLHRARREVLSSADATKWKELLQGGSI